MDEPDAPLSFTASLGLAALLHDLAAGPSQLLVASHSPILAAIPGANLLELGAWGIRPATWDDLSLVIYWRQFLNNPQSFFRHLLADSDTAEPDTAEPDGTEPDAADPPAAQA
jgi:predicted ATPase